MVPGLQRSHCCDLNSQWYCQLHSKLFLPFPMFNSLFNAGYSRLRPFLKPLAVVALIFVLVLGQADSALAARGGGRIGGGGFRAPSRSFSPNRSYRAPASRGYYPGGGFGFPFILPFFGFGGGFGGLFTIFLFIGLANFLVRTLRNVGGDGEDGQLGVTNPKVSVARVQIGLLAEARHLQADLNRMAETADTSSTTGLTQVLQEATLSLLRHPEYWAYAATECRQIGLAQAEAEFNRLALTERSKFSEETVSNVNSQVQQRTATQSALATAENPGEYIVATLVIGSQSRLTLPKVQSSQDLRQVLSQVGSISGEQLLALEVLWTPQATGETLSSDEVLEAYPGLTLI